MQAFSASCPAWPNGVWPRSCASAIASVRSSSSRRLRATERADLRHLEAVREPRAEEIAFVVDEHLRLVLEPPESGRMDDAVAVALVLAAAARRRLAVAPAADALGRAPRSGAAVLTHARRAARALGQRARRAPRRRRPRRALRSRMNRMPPALHLLVVPHQLEVALDAQVGRGDRQSGARRAARRCARHRPRRCSPRRCESRAASTMPAATASPCSQVP